MKRFVIKCAVFAMLLVVAYFLAMLLPPTPQSSILYHFSALQKDSLLAHTSAPRLIFVGGSNLSLGLNSPMLKDSLHLNPVNTGVNAAIGIKYMLENTLKYVRKGDIVVFIPEYNHFYTQWDYSSTELFRTLFEVQRDFSKFNTQHLRYSGKYVLSKFDITEYLCPKENQIYGRQAFNEYGDVDAHWTWKNLHKNVPRDDTYDISGYNPDVMNNVKLLANEYLAKGCLFYFSWPCYQHSSFELKSREIALVEQKYQENGFHILGTPARYAIPDSLMFDTPYHLVKEGIDLRTRLLIEDLKGAGIGYTENTR